MCGIAGIYRWDNKPADSALVSEMVETLTSRGPDGTGIYQQNNLCFGHRRLKIMDLSDAAHQPMVDSALGLTLVFNGAIYNYPELKIELESLGYRFSSNSDTEVILKGYHCWREGILQKLNGMFAFAIWERELNSLFIARDRLGIKPLYYAIDGGSLSFASTVPAMLKMNIDPELDPIALHHYLSFHSVVPAPRTLLKNVKKLPPASYMRISPDGSHRLQKYWSQSYSRTADELNRSREEWKELLLASLQKAVARRTLADVPVGVLLSGGVDSSLIVALLRESGARNLKTFSIGFNCHSGEDGNEFKYSDLVANTYDTEHHRYLIGTDKLIDMLPQTISAMSEPMMSHDCVGFYMLAQQVSKQCKVVQSGQGADEIFAGYHWYPKVDSALNPAQAYKNSFFDRDHSELSKLLLSEWVSSDFSDVYVQNYFNELGTEALDSALQLDTNVMLVDDPVKRVDNMTMAWGLEARVPFLDHEVVELSAKIPAKYKLPNGGKYLLKELARDWLPDAIIDRPKGYFPVPELKYITGNVLDYVKEILSQTSAKNRGLFNQKIIQSYIDSPKEHITPLNGSKLWQIAVLESWMQQNKI